MLEIYLPCHIFPLVAHTEKKKWFVYLIIGMESSKYLKLRRVETSVLSAS